MVRGYHLRDYDWTPLSQNPARICNDTLSAACVGRPRYTRTDLITGVLRWWSHSTWSLAVSPSSASGDQNDIHPMRRGGAKSFVDDLVLGRGVVLSRAATSLRSIETQPWTRRFVCFLDRQIIPGSLRFASLPCPALPYPSLSRTGKREGGRELGRKRRRSSSSSSSPIKAEGGNFSHCSIKAEGDNFNQKNEQRGGSNCVSLLREERPGGEKKEEEIKNNSGKFAPSALIKAEGGGGGGGGNYFQFFIFFVKAEGGNLEEKRAARVRGGSNWDSLKKIFFFKQTNKKQPFKHNNSQYNSL